MEAKPNAAAQNALTKLLYRADCPPSLELGEYQLGLLDKSRRNAIAKHVGECPHCTAELTQLQGFVARINPQTEPEPSLAERISTGVRVLVAELLGGTQQPALAMRGSEQAAPAIYMVDDIQLTMEALPDPENAGRHVLTGLVMGTESVKWQATLWQRDGFIADVEVDEVGAFSFGNLNAGEYQLVLGSGGGGGADGTGNVELHATVTV